MEISKKIKIGGIIYNILKLKEMRMNMKKKILLNMIGQILMNQIY